MQLLSALATSIMLLTIITLTILGFLLVFAEIYVPGAILGTLGGILLIGAVALSYWHYGFAIGNIALLVIGFVTIVMVGVGIYIFPSTPVGRRMMLNTSGGAPEDHPDHTGLVGKEGVALTSLRPSGAALIDGRRIDVVAQGGLIEKDAEVVVLHTEGAKVVVRLKA